MNETQDLGTGIKYFASKPFLMSLAIIGVTIVVLYVIKQFLIKKVAYTTKDEQHKNTFNGVIFSILQYIVVIIAVVSILHQHGVNVTRILAGLGIMATIIGLAHQHLQQQFLQGRGSDPLQRRGVRCQVLLRKSDEAAVGTDQFDLHGKQLADDFRREDQGQQSAALPVRV